MKIPIFKKMLQRELAPVVVPVKKTAVKKVTTKKAASTKVVVTKKVAVKKTAAKKVVAKKAANATKPSTVKTKTKSKTPRLVVASDSESFWVTNGHVLNSLVALELALKTMTKSVYDYHISNTGSDFADWVEQVLMTPACASELRKAKTATTAYRVVHAYLTKPSA